MRSAGLLAAITGMLGALDASPLVRSVTKVRVQPKVLWDSSREGAYRNPHKRARRDAIRTFGIRQFKRTIQLKGAF